MPLSLTLVGGNVPECCDQFSYQIDAVAELVPDETAACDFNGDSVCDTADVDLHVCDRRSCGRIASATRETLFLTLTRTVSSTRSTVDHWLSSAATENGLDAPYLKGDANLDGLVNATDLNALALSWHGSEKVWSEGDFTGEGIVQRS